MLCWESGASSSPASRPCSSMILPLLPRSTIAGLAGGELMLYRKPQGMREIIRVLPGDPPSPRQHEAPGSGIVVWPLFSDIADECVMRASLCQPTLPRFPPIRLLKHHQRSEIRNCGTSGRRCCGLMARKKRPALNTVIRTLTTGSLMRENAAEDARVPLHPVCAVEIGLGVSPRRQRGFSQPGYEGF